MVKYDPKILQKYAEMLYANARSIVFTAAVIAALVGIGPGIVVGKAVAVAAIPPADRSTVVVLLASAVVFVCGVIGYWVGQSIAFLIRLKAQLTLCQKQVEYNTRVAATLSQTSHLQEISA